MCLTRSNHNGNVLEYQAMQYSCIFFSNPKLLRRVLDERGAAKTEHSRTMVFGAH